MLFFNIFFLFPVVLNLSCSLHAMENNGKNPVRDEDALQVYVPLGSSEKAVYNLPLHMMPGFENPREWVAGLIVRLTGTTIKHDNSVCSVAWSPDGKYLATGSADNTARVTHIATGQEICRVRHGRTILSVALSPDGIYLATGSADWTARVTNVATEQEVLCVRHNNSVFSVAWSSDGIYLATGSDDKTARVTDWAVVRDVGNNATLNTYELLQAFQVAAQDTKELPRNQRARIHANKQQWNTWLALKEMLPERGIKRLEPFIVKDSLRKRKRITN